MCVCYRSKYRVSFSDRIPDAFSFPPECFFSECLWKGYVHQELPLKTTSNKPSPVYADTAVLPIKFLIQNFIGISPLGSEEALLKHFWWRVLSQVWTKKNLMRDAVWLLSRYCFLLFVPSMKISSFVQKWTAELMHVSPSEFMSHERHKNKKTPFPKFLAFWNNQNFYWSSPNMQHSIFPKEKDQIVSGALHTYM